MVCSTHITALQKRFIKSPSGHYDSFLKTKKQFLLYKRVAYFREETHGALTKAELCLTAGIWAQGHLEHSFFFFNENLNSDK